MFVKSSGSQRQKRNGPQISNVNVLLAHQTAFGFYGGLFQTFNWVKINLFGFIRLFEALVADKLDFDKF